MIRVEADDNNEIKAHGYLLIFVPDPQHPEDRSRDIVVRISHEGINFDVDPDEDHSCWDTWADIKDRCGVRE